MARRRGRGCCPELAQVRVLVGWERPTWRVSWQDGPTREALMGRAAALAGYRVGAPLPFEELRFARGSSAVAVALAWLAAGEPGVAGRCQGGGRRGGGVLCGHGLPADPFFDAGDLVAAEVVRRVGHGDIAEMGRLLAQAVPPVAAADMLVPGPELIGRVVSSRWPVGGPPEELLGPAGHRPEAGSGTARPRTCQRCGKPLKTDGSRGGRPAKYCSGACRTAAHRARHRTAPATAAR